MYNESFIVINIQGGLGNQLFGFSLARYFELRKNCKVYYDLNYFKSKGSHEYLLEELGLGRPCIPLETKLSRFLISFIRPVRLRNKISFCSRNLFFERGFEYDLDIKNINRFPVYFDGYWQSYKYFEEIADSVRDDISFVSKINQVNIDYSHAMNRENSVSVHIRRGDYLLEKNSKIHGMSSLEYYLQAIQFIKSKSKDPVFYFFSDDISWVRENFRNPSYRFVDCNSGSNSCLDLYLMSQCKHNIIANSTFSWWGAWLNRNNEKIIVAPSVWFKNQKKNTCDLIPPTWLRM